MKNHKLFALAIGILFFGTACRDRKEMFEKLSPSETNIHFENNLEKKRLFNILFFVSTFTTLHTKPKLANVHVQFYKDFVFDFYITF